VRFFALNEIQDWCAQRGIELQDGGRVPSDSGFLHTARVRYAAGQRSGRERAVAEACLRALSSWEECLLWITLTGVWPSGEDWPTFYALRGRQGERRSLDVAPGHVFTPGEEAVLLEFLTAVLENAWDAYLLPARSHHALDRRARVSHDEYVELQSRGALESDSLAVLLPAATVRRDVQGSHRVSCASSATAKRAVARF
jgi:hypothetical protein